MPTEEELRQQLANTRAKYELKIAHFNALCSVAKHMKFDIRDLAREIDILEKRVNKKSNVKESKG